MDTSMNIEVAEVELSSSCVCVFYDEFDVEVESDDCFDCWQDALEDLARDVFDPWLDALEAVDGDFIMIDGEGVGWLRRSGTITVEVERDAFVSDVLNNLTLNGDFRLVFRLVGDVLSVRRFSHDEPMGASFVFRFVSAENVEVSDEA